MASGQLKKDEKKSVSVKPGNQLTDLLEDQKQKVEALAQIKSSIDESNDLMENINDGTQLIDKLIKKRKLENEAFIKMLQAIETKGTENHENTNHKRKSKT